MTLKPGAKSSLKLNVGWLTSQTKKVQRKVLKALTTISETEAQALAWSWPFWARQDQLPPSGNWTSWMMLGGRGAGKTRAGAEWVRTCVEADPNDGGYRNIALVGETYGSTRAVMVEGPSGLLAISPPDFRPRLIASRQLLVWPNGAQARLSVGALRSRYSPSYFRCPIRADASRAAPLVIWRRYDMLRHIWRF